MGGEITDDAIGQLMQRREKQNRLSESWKLLAQVDMDLVICAVADAELKGPTTKSTAAAKPAEASPGQKAADEILVSEQQAIQAIQRLRAALGDARRAKVLECALEQI